MIKNKHRVRYINAFIAVSIAAIRTFQIDGINLRVLNIHFGGKSRNGYGKNHNKCDNRSKNLFHIIHIPPFFGKRKSIFAEYLPSAATRRTYSNICYHSPPRLSTPFPHLTKSFLICVKLCRKNRRHALHGDGHRQIIYFLFVFAIYSCLCKRNAGTTTKISTALYRSEY